VTVIDVGRRVQLAQLVIPGELGFAQGDGSGRVYATVRDRDEIMRLDGQAIGNAVQRIIDATSKARRGRTATPGAIAGGDGGRPPRPLILDWYSGAATNPPPEALPHSIALGSVCDEPRALAIDASHSRLFAACSNFRMAVVDPQSASVIAALPIGPVTVGLGTVDPSAARAVDE